MTHGNFGFLAGAALALLLGAASVALLDTPAASAQSGVPQGTTTTYAVLAASAVTSRGSSVVNGDLGISPATALTGFPPGVITGATHSGDPDAAQLGKREVPGNGPVVENVTPWQYLAGNAGFPHRVGGGITVG